MRITINFPTGNRFADGTAENGRIIEETVSTVDELDNILDRIPDGTDYTVTGENGESLYEIAKLLEG